MRSLTLVSALLLAALSHAAGGLSIGDSSPTLKVESMVKGEAVDLTKGIHVVEFWATWCGPCKVSIPHLTEMAHKYKGKVDFTGVDVWESGKDNAENLAKVKQFVETMGEKMDYNVAYDGGTKAMDEGFMKAAGQNGIPTAFLVKDGQVLWIGHPMGGLDKTIDKVLAGNFDVAAAKAEFDKQAAAQAEMEKKQAAMMAVLKPAMDKLSTKDVDGALVELDKIDAAHPELKPQTGSIRFSALLSSGSPKMLDFAKATVAGPNGKNAQILNSYAWSIIDPASKRPTPNYKAGLVLAEAAAKASDMKDGMILDTYALALFKNGEKKKALEIQTKAIELYKKSGETDADTVKEMEGRLDEYKKASA